MIVLSDLNYISSENWLVISRGGLVVHMPLVGPALLSSGDGQR
jgi:hypothetical protein